MGVSDILEIGKQGLAANRQALQTTSNNIANANAPGYSRQRAVITTREQVGKGSEISGGGVDVSQVMRVHDDFVERQLVDEVKNMGSSKMRSDGTRHLESLLNRNGFELGEQVQKFFNSYRELSTNPQAQAVRGQVVESASTLAKGFRGLTDSMEDMKRGIDLRIEQLVKETNTLSRELADLNARIPRLENVGENPNELLDRRDAIVRDLSQKLGYPISVNERGQININGTGSGVIVEGDKFNELVTIRTPQHGGKSDGSVDIFIKDAFGMHRATGGIHDGELAGLIHVRDQVVNATLERLDNAAYALANSVNEIHRQGVGMDGNTDRALFKDVGDIKGAAQRLALTDELKNNPDAIASALVPGAPGDNRIALQISALQDKALLPAEGIVKEGAEARNTLNESLNLMVGDVGARAQQEDQMMKHNEALVNQLDNYRQTISGVSLEEEAVHVIQYQAVFNAAAKTMKVGDELLQTILSLKS